MITRDVTVNDFIDWMRQSGSYKNHFSYDGARALFEWLEIYSDDMDTSIDFDPIAWCVEYTEYDSALEAYNEQHGEDDFIKVDDDNTEVNANAQALEWLGDNTMVIQLDNGGVIIQDF